MMYATNFNGGAVWMVIFNVIFTLATLVGLVLLVGWMLKNLKPQQLLVWAVSLLVVGLVGGIVVMAISQYRAPSPQINGIQMMRSSGITGPGTYYPGSSIQNGQPVNPQMQVRPQTPVQPVNSPLNFEAQTPATATQQVKK
jgi:hypothetical protein